MKRILNIALMLTMYYAVNAQCMVFAEEELAKYCHGTYLIHKELNNDVKDANLLLNKGNIYTLYLLNPTHKKFGYSLVNDFNQQGYFLHITNKSDDYQEYVIQVSKSMEHKISLDLENDQKACVLMAVYLQDSLPGKYAGVYNSFEDLSQNKPSAGYITAFTEEKEPGTSLSGKELETYFYSLVNKEEKSKFKKIYCFCDGVDLYLNVAAVDPLMGRPNRFAKVEKIGNYYYFRTTRLIVTSNVAVPKIIQFIVDINTGKATELTAHSIRSIISDNQDLSKEFQSEKNKQEKLKDYLKRYFAKGNI